jgi:hypothetical protein
MNLVDGTTLVDVDVAVIVTVATLVFVTVTVAAIEQATSPKMTKKTRSSFILVV